jgi:glycerophosphoryl diester phosphodiesterase
VAHRGAWKRNHLPENSIASLKAAIALGCMGSEFDVRMTADDSLVINHDPAYNGLTIEKTNYSQLLAYTLSNGEKIPTLREYITAGIVDKSNTQLIIEIKPSDISKERGKAVAATVVHLINELGATQKVQYISFDYDMLQTIIALEPAAITQYLEGDRSPEQLKADGIRGADFHFSVYEEHPDWIAMAVKNQIILNAWTVNEETKMRELLEKGVQLITTNEPELALKIYNERLKNK